MVIKSVFQYLNDLPKSPNKNSTTVTFFFEDWGQQQLQGTLFGRFAQAGLPFALSEARTSILESIHNFLFPWNINMKVPFQV